MNNLSIRKATACDINLIRDLASNVWNQTYGSVHSQEQLDYMFEQMYSIQSLSNQLSDGHHFYILYSNNDPAGYFSFQQTKTDFFVLHKLYLLPDFQGIGAGKYMFTAIVSLIKEIHPEPCTLELTVNRKNTAIRFYEQMGMKAHRESDEPIGNGYYMNCLYMQMII